MSSLNVDSDIDETVNLLGKTVSDLQTGITVGNNAVTGTLKYVTGYTGYSGTAAEQGGNYLALHASSECADSITVKKGNNTAVTLDADGIAVLRITDKTVPVTITAIKGTETYSVTLNLNGLTLEEAG